MIDVIDVDPFLLETYCVFQAFRRMGFPSEALFFAADDDGNVIVELQWQGEKGGVRVGRQRGQTHESLVAKWKAFLERQSDLPEEFLDEAWERSKARAQVPSMLAALLMRGIRPPISLETES